MSETKKKWIAVDAIDATKIDWGTGTNQVSADDIPNGSTNAVVTLVQESNWDSHIGVTDGNPHGTDYTDVGAIQNSDNTVKENHIDWGSGANQVAADNIPIIDTNANFTATDVDGALEEFAEQLLAMFKLVSGFTADGASDDVDSAIDSASSDNTPRTSFSAGKGVFVDASGDYSNGASLPSTGTQVTEFGLPGTIFLRDSTTKDPVTDGSGNQVYGVLFYDTSDSKYYIKYFSDVSDSQTAYSSLSSQSLDFKFAEIFNLKGLDPTAIIKGGDMGGTDLASTSNASSVGITDSGGNYVATTVEDALAEQMSILTKATLSSGDETAGWKSFATKARGAAGEKTFVQLFPMGGPPQEYGVDYTAMNNDANNALIIIWKTSGTVTGIASPTYPSAGLMSKLEENDVIQVAYNK